MSNDKVNHPSHYTYGKIECIDFIQDKKLNFCLGNAIKYIVRAGHKHSEGMDDNDKAIEDLKKAKQYIEFEIKERENKMFDNSEHCVSCGIQIPEGRQVCEFCEAKTEVQSL